MKIIKTELQCYKCEEIYYRDLIYPSWYDYIFSSVITIDLLDVINKIQCFGLCHKCRNYIKLKEEKERKITENTWIKERDKFLKALK